MSSVTLEQIDRIAGELRSRCSLRPRVAIILGSGLNNVANSVRAEVRIPFGDLPGWPVSTVQGHSGRLLIGHLEGREVLVMQGRIHAYEGYSMAQVTLPVRVMQRLGVEILIVTNAAGAIHPDLMPGDLMLILDHINLIGMVGGNPLWGPNLDEFGPRFPDMSQAYDRQLHALAREAAREAGIPLREGVYCGLGGPSFETPAELRFLRVIGADAVGMSTVGEVTVARHGGMRVLGLSGISNKANLDGSTVTSHEEVLEAGRVIGPKVDAVVRGVLRRL